MKRFLALLLAALLLGGCTGVSTPPSKADETPPPNVAAPGADAPARDCTIAHIYDELLLLYDEMGDLYTLDTSGLLMVTQDEQELTIGDLAVGQRVSVFFDGGVLESYPSRFAQPTKLIARGESTDLLELYLALFDELWAKDAGLNEGISVLAFELSGSDCPYALTQAQKNALFYILGSRLGYDVFESDFETLQTENYIIKEPDSPMLHFPGGLFFQLTISEWDNNSFTFEFSKWRSSLGAYFLAECKAVCKSNSWSYTVGAEMIS